MIPRQGARWGVPGWRSTRWPILKSFTNPFKGDTDLDKIASNWTINAPTVVDPGRLRGSRRAAGTVARQSQGHTSERHPEGVRRPGDIHLPAQRVAAAFQGLRPVLQREATSTESDQHLRLSHERSRGQPRPGAGFCHGQCDRLRPGGSGCRPGRGLIHRPVQFQHAWRQHGSP